MNRFLLYLSVLTALFFPVAYAQECSYCGCFEFDLEYLYWNAREDQLPFAFTTEKFADDNIVIPGTPIGNISVADQEFPWTSGVRLGVGYYLPCSCWNANFHWTYFQTNSRTTVSSSTNKHIIASPFYLPLFASVANKGESRWGLNYNDFSFELGYCANLPCCLIVEPHFGAKGVMIWQRQNLKYEGMVDFAVNRVAVSAQRKNRFWGIGPTTGVDLQWTFCRHLSVISRTKTALLFGRFHLAEENFLTDLVTHMSVEPIPHLQDRPYRGRPMFGGYLGLGWDSCLCGIPFELAAGYEMEYWWQQWGIGNSIDRKLGGPGGTWGDLLLHGLTLSLKAAY